MRLQFAVAIFLVAQLSCFGQQPSATDRAQDRTIEKLIRANLRVPNDWEIVPGKRSPSATPDFDALDVTFFPTADPSHSQHMQFLLAKDGTRLGQLVTWPLGNLPADEVNISSRPVRGNPNATVTIVSYDDLECPYCAIMHAQLFSSTLDHYKDLVRVVYKDSPLVEIHAWAMHAAVDANCLGAQSGPAYWSYLDRVHARRDEITGPDRDAAKAHKLLDSFAEEEGQHFKVNPGSLSACIAAQDETAVRNEMKEAASLRLDGTPAVIVNGERLVGGARPTAEVWDSIDRALRAEGVTPPPREPAVAKSSPAQGPASQKTF